MPSLNHKCGNWDSCIPRTLIIHLFMLGHRPVDSKEGCDLSGIFLKTLFLNSMLYWNKIRNHRFSRQHIKYIYFINVNLILCKQNLEIIKSKAVYCARLWRYQLGRPWPGPWWELRLQLFSIQSTNYANCLLEKGHHPGGHQGCLPCWYLHHPVSPCPLRDPPLVKKTCS